jgi:hypothetical protein
MSRDDVIRAITYTHDGGVKIEVQPEIQQVFIPSEFHNKAQWLGPFPPFDVEQTCIAIEQLARFAKRPSLMQASYDWYQLNREDQRGRYERLYHFKW